MAWQTPKTDWSREDGVRDSDLNRIEGNIMYLYKDKVREDTYLYVNASTGNDTTGTGTSASPFKTINKALNSVSRDTNGKEVFINIAAGNYAEDIVIRGFSTPVVLTNNGQSITVNRLRVDGCHCSLSGNIEILANNIIYVDNGGSITGVGALYVNNAGVNLNNGSTVSINRVTCDNSPNYAIDVSGSSRFFATSLEGRANAFGMRATGGSVLAYGSTTMGVNGLATFTSMGGRIVTGSGTTSPGGIQDM